MRMVVQRVSRAAVRIDGAVTAAIGPGLLILLGVARQDTEADANLLADKAAALRIFPDAEGRMNRSVTEAGGSLLVVSQFTLYGDVRKGRRPSFDRAASGEQARALYERFVDRVRTHGLEVRTGIFQAMMQVELCNEGPVTIIADSEKIV
jgi:D-tyrosyl-tRNA(Tyr) deacylase